MIAIADCNSFYASCEKLFRPDLIGKPVVVLSNNDGCIVSRTDEASINYSQGSDAITIGAAGKSKTWKMRQEMRSPLYTTRWEDIPFIG